MAWPAREHLETLIDKAQQILTDVRLIRYEVSLSRALVDLEARWGNCRIIVSEIHRANGSVRYAYYVLNENNQLLHGFDNSPDVLAVKLRYGVDWKAHCYEEIPHQHDADRNLTLTAPITFDTFIEWLRLQIKL